MGKNFYLALTSECANASDFRVYKAHCSTKPKRDIGCRLSLLFADAEAFKYLVNHRFRSTLAGQLQ